MCIGVQSQHVDIIELEALLPLQLEQSSDGSSLPRLHSKTQCALHGRCRAGAIWETIVHHAQLIEDICGDMRPIPSDCELERLG